MQTLILHRHDVRVNVRFYVILLSAQAVWEFLQYGYELEFNQNTRQSQNQFPIIYLLLVK